MLFSAHCGGQCYFLKALVLTKLKGEAAVVPVNAMSVRGEWRYSSTQS